MKVKQNARNIFKKLIILKYLKNSVFLGTVQKYTAVQGKKKTCRLVVQHMQHCPLISFFGLCNNAVTTTVPKYFIYKNCPPTGWLQMICKLKTSLQTPLTLGNGAPICEYQCLPWDF